MKKIFTLVMTLALICALLASCGESAVAKLDKANDALAEAPYSMTMQMNFECDNEELNEILSMMNMEVPVTIDGKNMAMDMSMEIMEGYAVDAKISVVDMIMYYDMDFMGQSIKMKAAMSEEQYQGFMAESNTEMAVDYRDFAKLTEETKDGKTYITCEEISEEGLKELNEMIQESLADSIEEASVSDITYVITLSDGKYESMDMSCVYSITVEGETYSVTFNVNADFSYDDVAEITAPEDADAYQEMDYSELMG